MNELAVQKANDFQLDNEKLSTIKGIAKLMASATVTLPKHLQNKEADCFAICLQAAQWGMNPMAVAQKTHLVNGTLGYEAQLVNAVIQNSGLIRGSFKYEFKENPIQCRVGAVLAGEEQITWGEWLSINDVQTKNSPLWKTNPKQQMGYLQCKNWARLYAPGAILGVYSTDELQAMPVERDVTPVRAENLISQAEKDALTEAVVETPKQPTRKVREQSQQDLAQATYAQIADMISNSQSEEESQAALGQGKHLPDDQMAELVDLHLHKWEKKVGAGG